MDIMREMPVIRVRVEDLEGLVGDPGMLSFFSPFDIIFRGKG